MRYERSTFVEILEMLRENMADFIDMSEISGLETNPVTQIMHFNCKKNNKTGMIVVGENNNKIVIEVIVDDHDDVIKGTPVIEMQKKNIKLLNELVEWFEKYNETKSPVLI
ncbi:hypothetical protein [Oceanirhabdus sp. W0125-5]|uniref:hypothetical protein n=1 Tax=Oceanirhabdus sp. W0125-5 TaxID=2999116 RepID=UPI0022F32DCD|nr:hypothetical protein [Oceanirhabdus sp. W0125-5]WBW96762.1 hypothetical protein OW730_24180 [Oceanirhabdus sp. W0125-5]